MIIKGQLIMNTYCKTLLAGTLVVSSIGQVSAGIYESSQVIDSQQFSYNQSQVLALVDSNEVQQKLNELGITPADAKHRISNMTAEELASFNQQLNDAPAGGIVGTVVTVLVVVAVLDVMGITDVYPFIRPL